MLPQCFPTKLLNKQKQKITKSYHTEQDREKEKRSNWPTIKLFMILKPTGAS